MDGSYSAKNGATQYAPSNKTSTNELKSGVIKFAVYMFILFNNQCRMIFLKFVKFA